VAPPTFVNSSNRPDDVAEHYQRYLLRGFRRAWDFSGVPIRLRFKARHKAAR
jgi:predicted GTPase